MDPILIAFWVVLAVGYIAMLAVTSRAERRFIENPTKRVPGCGMTYIVSVPAEECPSAAPAETGGPSVARGQLALPGMAGRTGSPAA